MSSNISGSHYRLGGGGGGGQGQGTVSNVDHGRGRGRGRGDAPIIDRTSTPRGICHFYWSIGVCDRGFDCTFRHQAKDQVTVSSPATQSTDHTPDFFSLEGLATNNGSIVDARHTLSPSEAHNHLRVYLFDNIVFHDAINVEGFSRIFASVTSRNRAWVGRASNFQMVVYNSRHIGF